MSENNEKSKAIVPASQVELMPQMLDYQSLIKGMMSAGDTLPEEVSRALFGEPIESLGRHPFDINPDNIQSANIDSLFAIFIGRIKDGLAKENSAAVIALYTVFGEQVAAIVGQGIEHKKRIRKNRLKHSNAAYKLLYRLLEVVSPKLIEDKEITELNEVRDMIAQNRAALRAALAETFLAPSQAPEYVQNAQQLMAVLNSLKENAEKLSTYLRSEPVKAEIYVENGVPIYPRIVVHPYYLLLKSKVQNDIQRVNNCLSSSTMYKSAALKDTIGNWVSNTTRDDEETKGNMQAATDTLCSQAEIEIHNLEKMIEEFISSEMAQFLKQK